MSVEANKITCELGNQKHLFSKVATFISAMAILLLTYVYLCVLGAIEEHKKEKEKEIKQLTDELVMLHTFIVL